MTPDQLRRIMSKADPSWVGPLTDAMQEFGIDTALRQACFLGQIAVESGELRLLEENLNYSAQGLMATFPHYFSTSVLAQQYAHQPQKIANYVYAKRMGNGDEQSGDGWEFRGRGLIQLTGRSNYRAAEQSVGCALEVHPDLALDPTTAARIAGWYWQSRGLNGLADYEDVTAITKKINGGVNGLAQRQAYTAKAKAALA